MKLPENYLGPNEDLRRAVDTRSDLFKASQEKNNHPTLLPMIQPKFITKFSANPNALTAPFGTKIDQFKGATSLGSKNACSFLKHGAGKGTRGRKWPPPLVPTGAAARGKALGEHPRL